MVDEGDQHTDRRAAPHQHKAGGEGVRRQVAARQLGVLLPITPAIYPHLHLLLKEGRETGAGGHFLVLEALQREGLQILQRATSLVLDVLALDLKMIARVKHP